MSKMGIDNERGDNVKSLLSGALWAEVKNEVLTLKNATLNDDYQASWIEQGCSTSIYLKRFLTCFKILEIAFYIKFIA